MVDQRKKGIPINRAFCCFWRMISKICAQIFSKSELAYSSTLIF